MSMYDILAYQEDCRKRLRETYRRCVEKPNSKAEADIFERCVVDPGLDAKAIERMQEEPNPYENLPSDVRADIEAEDFKDLES